MGSAEVKINPDLTSCIEPTSPTSRAHQQPLPARSDRRERPRLQMAAGARLRTENASLALKVPGQHPCTKGQVCTC